MSPIHLSIHWQFERSTHAVSPTHEKTRESLRSPQPQVKSFNPYHTDGRNVAVNKEQGKRVPYLTYRQIVHRESDVSAPPISSNEMNEWTLPENYRYHWSMIESIAGFLEDTEPNSVTNRNPTRTHGRQRATIYYHHQSARQMHSYKY